MYLLTYDRKILELICMMLGLLVFCMSPNKASMSPHPLARAVYMVLWLILMRLVQHTTLKWIGSHFESVLSSWSSDNYLHLDVVASWSLYAFWLYAYYDESNYWWNKSQPSLKASWAHEAWVDDNKVLLDPSDASFLEKCFNRCIANVVIIWYFLALFSYDIKLLCFESHRMIIREN